jgi:dCMP deaminase
LSKSSSDIPSAPTIIDVPLKGCSIYVPWCPCAEYAKAIIQVGISEVVAYQPDYSDEKWGQEFSQVDIMFKEAGIRVRFNS